MVRLHFQQEPWDLYVMLAYAIVTSIVVLVVGTGGFLGIPFLILAPGYVLLAAIFPGNSQVDWMERLIFSLGLSFAIVPLLGLLLTFSPSGIRVAPIVISIVLFVVVVGFLGCWRRLQLPPDKRLSGTLDLKMPRWTGRGMLDKGLVLTFAATVVLTTAVGAYIILKPRMTDRFTEFYTLGPSGNTSGYPVALNRSQQGTLVLGLVNHESEAVDYTIHVDLVGIQILHNSTSGVNETVEVNRTSWSWINVTLANNRNWTRPYTFSIPYVGVWKVQFQLFKNRDFSSPYRELHLHVVVS